MKHNHSAFTARAAYSHDANRRIEQFLPLVRKLAWLYESSCGAALDVDDLMQVGLIALTECVQRHDRPSDDGFAAYVKMRVRGAMIDLLRSQSTQPRGATEFARKHEQAIASLRAALHRDASSKEIAVFMELALPDYQRMCQHLATTTWSLDDCYSDQDGAFADDRPDAQTQLLDIEDREALTRAIGELPERLQLVIKLHFVKELNLSEIAAVLSISVPRVHQLKASALKKLRLVIAQED